MSVFDFVLGSRHSTDVENSLTKVNRNFIEVNEGGKQFSSSGFLYFCSIIFSRERFAAMVRTAYAIAKIHSQEAF